MVGGTATQVLNLVNAAHGKEDSNEVQVQFSVGGNYTEMVVVNQFPEGL